MDKRCIKSCGILQFLALTEKSVVHSLISMTKKSATYINLMDILVLHVYEYDQFLNLSFLTLFIIFYMKRPRFDIQNIFKLEQM